MMALSSPSRLNSSSLQTLSDQVMFKNSFQIHIPQIFSLRTSSFFKVHNSAPYRRVLKSRGQALHDDVTRALHAGICSQGKNKMAARSGGGFTCCVPGCFTNSKRDTHLSFYVSPKEKNLRRRWLHLISRKNVNLTTGHRVCSLHFKGGKKPT